MDIKEQILNTVIEDNKDWVSYYSEKLISKLIQLKAVDKLTLNQERLLKTLTEETCE